MEPPGCIETSVHSPLKIESVLGAHTLTDLLGSFALGTCGFCYRHVNFVGIIVNEFSLVFVCSVDIVIFLCIVIFIIIIFIQL